MKCRSWLEVLALSLSLLGCGATTHGREDDSGNTNWLKPCDADADCGTLSCACGLCGTACAGVNECSREPEQRCVASVPEPGPATPRRLREHRDPKARAYDLALGPDGAVTLVGGTDPAVSDLTLWHPTFWLSKLSPQGDPQWTYVEPSTDDSGNTGLSLGLTPEGDAIALSTIYDGSDTPALRRISADGELLESWTSAPGFTTLRSDGAGGLFAAGSKLLEFRGGRPFTSAWLARFDEIGSKSTTWETERRGTDGSVSNIQSASSDVDGNLLVAGSLGVAADSNASQPWLALFDRDGAARWEATIPVLVTSHCSTSAISLAPDGSALAAIDCEPRWLRSYATNGSVIWERGFASYVTALAALADGGYVVALSSLQSGAPEALLQRFDAGHRLLWQTNIEGCQAVERLAVTAEGVLALAGCDEGYSLGWYADP